MIAVHQRHQGFPERCDAGRGRVLFGEVQACGGGYAIHVVTRAATGLLQHGIESPGEVSLTAQGQQGWGEGQEKDE